MALTDEEREELRRWAASESPIGSTHLPHGLLGRLLDDLAAAEQERDELGCWIAEAHIEKERAEAAETRASDLAEALCQEGYEDTDIGWHLKDCPAYIDWIHYQTHSECGAACISDRVLLAAQPRTAEPQEGDGG